MIDKGIEPAGWIDKRIEPTGCIDKGIEPIGCIDKGIEPIGWDKRWWEGGLGKNALPVLGFDSHSLSVVSPVL